MSEAGRSLRRSEKAIWRPSGLTAKSYFEGELTLVEGGAACATGRTRFQGDGVAIAGLEGFGGTKTERVSAPGERAVYAGLQRETVLDGGAGHLFAELDQDRIGAVGLD